ncbi:hypothetical protein ACI7BZ_03430 [Xanthobacter sp. AM11]|uniref:hypothetical protein n=1 Tax=Xanthobacter sp. AM11 TaxID=3380643 RepID=UPI0039BFC96B
MWDQSYSVTAGVAWGATKFYAGLAGVGFQSSNNLDGQNIINVNGFYWGYGVDINYNRTAGKIDTFQIGPMAGFGFQLFGLGGSVLGKIGFGADNPIDGAEFSTTFQVQVSYGPGIVSGVLTGQLIMGYPSSSTPTATLPDGTVTFTLMDTVESLMLLSTQSFLSQVSIITPAAAEEAGNGLIAITPPPAEDAPDSTAAVPFAAPSGSAALESAAVTAVLGMTGGVVIGADVVNPLEPDPIRLNQHDR